MQKPKANYTLGIQIRNASGAVVDSCVLIFGCTLDQAKFVMEQILEIENRVGYLEHYQEPEPGTDQDDNTSDKER